MMPGPLRALRVVLAFYAVVGLVVGLLWWVKI
jgi:hypothetical protein